MEDEPKSNGIIYWALGAMGLGAVGAAVSIPKYGIWLALVIVVLALLLFGGYFLYRRMRARKQSRNFEGAIQAQTSDSPRAISDPNRRAALDKLRQKFQTGLQEFKSRGKDIYKLPWYVIIGEPGSGKSEAIRHSGLDFPPGLQGELQGSGGTVNMDWWFTNRSIILDTAGSMIFNESQAGEAPEWREFLRLLRRARPNCPVNGLFLVLSVESLIKDSADKIAQKAGKLAQQLDLIQRTLDVRFPVYLLVTKCDLLTGFREFFDNIEDPLLQHQIFGWSNPDPLDSHFRPELVEQHLKIVAERVRRRRLALLRESASATRYGDTAFFTAKSPAAAAGKRRLDELDSLYALPESVMLLAPRLRRYLEIIFVAGEWSAKPVFLRGIYFTSSMREGRALDEAMALATGVSLEQLPEDRPWEKNRSYFMRDLFLEKVFREHGLVTRATNTLQVLRKRKLLIFGVASVLLLVLLGFAFLSYRSLSRSVLAESSYWNAGATNWNQGEWSPPLVRAGGGDNIYHFVYAGGDPVAGLGLTVAGYHQRLMEITEHPLAVSWVFRPLTWFGGGRDMNRKEAQRLILEGGVLRPLVDRTREKMTHQTALITDPVLVGLHRDALLSLIRLETDALAPAGSGRLAGDNAPVEVTRYLQSFLSYLTDTNLPPDTNLVAVIVHTYGGNQTGSAKWPPASLLGGNSLADNLAVSNGLVVLRKASLSEQDNLAKETQLLGDLADSLHQYEQLEAAWLASRTDPCDGLQAAGGLAAARQTVDQAWLRLRSLTNSSVDPSTNLTAHYFRLEKLAADASVNMFQGIGDDLPEASKTSGLFADINVQIRGIARQARQNVQTNYDLRGSWLTVLDRDQMAPAGNGETVGQARWDLYTNACAMAGSTLVVDDSFIGNEWKRLNELKARSDLFRTKLAAYQGPLVDQASNICQRIAGEAEVKLKGQLVDSYASLAAGMIHQRLNLANWSGDQAADARDFLDRLTRDLKAASGQFSPQDRSRLLPVSQALLDDAAQLPRKTGFPVQLNGNADQAMKVADLMALRNLLPVLTEALNDPAWNGILVDTSGRARSVAQNLNNYGKVVSALLNPDGKLAGVELFFMPPKEGADDAIIRDYRRAEVVLGDADSNWQEVAQHIGEGPVSMVKGTVGGALQIKFQAFANTAAVSAEDLGGWALVRLIQQGQVQRSDSGTEWTLTLKVQDSQQNLSGPVVFKFVTERPLPKMEDWPQQ